MNMIRFRKKLIFSSTMQLNIEALT